MSGKKVMRNLFSGKPLDAVPMLLPIIPLGAKIMQVSTSTVASDPALLVQCALQIKQLLAPQGMVLYDPATVAQAFDGMLRGEIGFPETVRQVGNIALTLETTQRLSATLGKEVAVFAAIPGPVELVLSMNDAGEGGRCLTDQQVMDSLSKLLIDLAKEYMENRADGLVVVESKKHFAREELAGFYSRFLTTVGNMAAYYGIPLIIYLQGQEEVGQLPINFSSLDFKGIIFDGCSKSGSLAETFRNVGDRVFGLTVPEDLLLQMSTGVHEYLKRLSAELPGKRLMLSVPWMMTEDLSVTHVIGLNDLIKKAG